MRGECDVWGCHRPIRKVRWCHAHYESVRRGNDPASLGPIYDNDRDRFLAKIDVTAGCWLWTGATASGGRYGVGTYEKRTRPAHRIAVALHTGQLPPDGMDVDHLCRVTLCVNPAHLDVVEHRENVLRGAGVQAFNARKTHCIRGHAFDAENTIRSGGARQCRACREIRNAKRRGEQWAIEAWETRLHDQYATRDMEAAA